jgi:hypothetical protein
MGVGLLILVSVGKENLYLSSQPEITFFKVAYKRYTNFSIESITQFFKSTPDFGRHVTVNLSKNADLLGSIHLYVELPTIPQSNPSILPSDIKQFAWTKKIGLALLNYVDLEISGILIDRQYGDYLNIWYELVVNLGLKKGYNKMIGNVDILTNFSNGKLSYTLYVPLNFWFCQDSGLSLPIIAMIHNDIKIHVQFNEISKCYIQSPTNYIKTSEPFTLFKKGEIITQTIGNNTVIGQFVYYDVINNNMYYNKIKDDFLIPSNSNDINYSIKGTVSKFVQDLLSSSKVIIDEDYFRFSVPSLQTANLLVNYIYLDNTERFLFINNSIEYLVPITQNIQEQTFYSTNVIYRIPFFNPIKIIFWRAQLLSNYNANDTFNYSLYPINYNTNNSNKLIENEYLVLNSVNRMELSKSEYYTNIQVYQNKFSTPQDGIHMFTFCINPLEYQPSGSMNFSKIDDAYIQLNLNKLINYQTPTLIKAYGIQLNVFRVFNGLSGLAYYL